MWYMKVLKGMNSASKDPFHPSARPIHCSLPEQLMYYWLSFLLTYLCLFSFFYYVPAVLIWTVMDVCCNYGQNFLLTYLCHTSIAFEREMQKWDSKHRKWYLRKMEVRGCSSKVVAHGLQSLRLPTSHRDAADGEHTTKCSCSSG